jgi:hypothetical protein
MINKNVQQPKIAYNSNNNYHYFTLSLNNIYEGQSKIICNVGTCCAVGYTAGWA